MAGAAIGVSHLVQSTRAGASFGWSLTALVLAANLFKYPFFEFGHRFASLTGKTLLEGYKEQGRFYLYTFLGLNIVTSVVSVAGVVIVTAALAENLLPGLFSIPTWSALLITISLVISLVGQYRALDYFIKLMLAVLFISTVCAFAIAFGGNTLPGAEIASQIFTLQNSKTAVWTSASLPFLIALMGWMPAPIELSVWQSIWVLEMKEQKKEDVPLKAALFDFNFGYAITVILALLFMGLGAFVMYSSPAEFSPKPAEFAAQVVKLFTSQIGLWSTPFITMAAMTAMISTVITLVDAYPKSLALGFGLVSREPQSKKKSFVIWSLLVGFFGVALISFYSNRLKEMVDLATILSFMLAPIFAFLNFKIVLRDGLTRNTLPVWIKVLSVLGLVFLTVFAVLYLASVVAGLAR